MNNILTRTSLRRPFATICLAVTLLISSLGLAPAAATQTNNFSDVPATHWAYSNIMWSKDQGIAQGYVDGTFRPAAPVTEAELLAMLVRAYPSLKPEDASANQKWYTPYYELAYSLNWPVQQGKAELKTARGNLAQIFAAALGQSMTQSDSIQYLIDKGIAQGKHGAATVENFDAGSILSRAEAQTFLYRLKQLHPDLEPTKIHTPSIQLSGIQLGDREAIVIQQLGQPDRKDRAPGGMVWYIYNKDYKEYAQVGIEAGVVTALFGNDSNWTYGSAEGLVSIASQASTLWGAETNSAKHVKSYQPKGYGVSLYIDSLHNNHPIGLLIQKDSTRVNNRTISAQVRSGYEKQLLDLANMFRADHGLSALAWNETAAAAARQHSQDMAKRNFFDHDNPDGKTPADRLAAHGLSDYRALGENISAGYNTPFEAHYSWINSQGHRTNLLSALYTTLGVGVVSGLSSSSYDIYYTQNFYTPH